MKKQSLSITIPKPCHENWSEMTQVEQGRHCLSCQKTVVDFTRMPKVKIAEYVSENQGGMCGRFTPDQLNVELIPPKPSKSWLKYAAIILGLAPTLGYSQQVSKKSNPVPTQMNNENLMGDVELEIPETGEFNVRINNQNQTVSGILVDEKSGEPIIFGTVALYKKGVLITGVETDIDGKFSISNEGDEIEASYIGYEPKRIKLSAIQVDKDLIIRIKERNAEVMMGIMVKVKDCNEENWFERLWSKFKELVIGSRKVALENRDKELNESATKKEFTDEIDTVKTETASDENKSEVIEEKLDIRVFPNPTSGIVSIEIPEHITEFTINVSNISNELVFTKTYYEKINTLDLSALISGSYIISIIHEDRLIHSEMVVKM